MIFLIESEAPLSFWLETIDIMEKILNNSFAVEIHQMRHLLDIVDRWRSLLLYGLLDPILGFLGRRGDLFPGFDFILKMRRVLFLRLFRDIS